MNKIYITFGQVHVHFINGRTFDKDCVAIIDCANEKDGRGLAFKYFDDKFFTSYYNKTPDMSFFPRGFMNVMGGNE